MPQVFLIFAATYLVGGAVVNTFRYFVLWQLGDKEKWSSPGWIIGIFERAMAFLLLLFAVPDAETIMVAWIAAKLAANWQRHSFKDDEGKAEWIAGRTLTALMAGVLSLAIGAAGGSIGRCYLPLGKSPDYCAWVTAQFPKW